MLRKIFIVIAIALLLTACGGTSKTGVDLDYEVPGQGNGMLMVSASGTAVVVE